MACRRCPCSWFSCGRCCRCCCSPRHASSDGQSLARVPTLLENQFLEQQNAPLQAGMGKKEARRAQVQSSGLRFPIQRSGTTDSFVDCFESFPPEWTPQDTELDGLPSKSLLAAVSMGKYAAAQRELLDLQRLGVNPHQLLDDGTIRRVQRIGAKFTEATRMLQMEPEALKINEHNKQLGLRWGMKLEGGVLQILSVQDYDVDILKMVAFDLQRDLEDKTSEDDISQEIFGEPFAHDVCWRRRAVNKSTGTKYDDLVMVSCVNALDEPMNAICSLKYTLPQSAKTDPNGVPIPALDAGYVRTPYLMIVTSFQPLSLGGNKMQGVRKSECIEMELPSGAAKVLSMMPGFVLKKVCRGNLETTVKRTIDLLTSATIDPALQAPYRAQFLEQIRQHIAGATQAMNGTSEFSEEWTQGGDILECVPSPSNVLADVSTGRYAAAWRGLLDLQVLGTGPRDILDDAVLKRVQRIGNKFTDATRMLQLKPEALKINEHNKQLGLRWGMKLDGPIMQILSVQDYDVDIMKMIAFDLQRDLEDRTSEDDITQEIWGKPHAHDVCWRRRAVNKSTGTKYDDLVMVSCVNALDEPMRAVCSLKYTLPPSAETDPNGGRIPAVDAGYVRTPYLMIATSFQPLSLGGRKMQGVRKSECIEVELPSGAAKVLGMMPGFVLKKVCRGSLEMTVKRTIDLLSSDSIDRDLEAPYRAEFLEQVRRQINGLP